MNHPPFDITHLLERHREHECAQQTDTQHGLPLHESDLNHISDLLPEATPSASGSRLSIPNIFPDLLRSLDNRIPGREDPIPAPLKDLWSEASTACEYLTALTEIVREVAVWRVTYEGMRTVDEIHLHNLEVDLGEDLRPGTPLFDSPKDDDQLRRSLSGASKKVEEVFGKMQDRKEIHEKIALLVQTLTALEKVAGLVGKAAALEAVLDVTRSSDSLEEASLDLRAVEYEIDELGAYIEVQWREVEGRHEIPEGVQTW